jgi:hypothetical protein
MDALRVDDSTRQGERTLSIAIGESRTDLVAVRQRVRDLLTSYPDVMVIDAVYVTDALATNAYDHGQAPVVLRLRLLPARRCLRIEVDDTAVFLAAGRAWLVRHPRSGDVAGRPPGHVVGSRAAPRTQDRVGRSGTCGLPHW